MNEVSCKVFGFFVKPLEKKGVTFDSVVAGTTVSVEKFVDKKARIDWADFVGIMRNMRAHFTDDEYIDLGRSYLRAPGLRFAFVIARLLLSPLDLFRWFNKPHDGVGNQMFRCMVPTHRELSPREIECDITVNDGFEVCWDFYVITIGNFSELPTLFGWPPAEVTLTRLPNGGRFHILLAGGRRPFLKRLVRVFMWPFTARAAARELKAANADLVERYEQLERTTAELEDYKATLEHKVDKRTAELREARDQLSVTVDQLREAQSARERFFGNISHEIRTPLSLIMLAAGDIQARAGALLDTRSSQSLTSVTDAARKLVRLVDELLLLAAGQEGKFKVHREPTDVAALAKHLVSAWRPATEKAGIALSMRVPDSLVANVDPVAIERVASNLMSNAVKYTPRGGAVELELVEEADSVRLSVLDTGPGIDADLATRLFGRFERGAGDRNKVGTGIGLALVKQLVEAHEGTIEAKQRASGGSELRVVLPHTSARDAVAPIRGLAIEVAERTPTIESGTRFDPPGVSAGTIVIAEDNAGLAEATARLLAGRYTVIVGLDGEAAAALVTKHQPQLLITDIDMPKMNGIELAKRFRELTGDRLAPIIMLSAVIDLGTRVAGLEAGAIDYVTKPFDPRELIARVDAQFRMRELAVRLHQAEQLSTLGILTSGLAHELRNPANGIVNAIEPIRGLLPSDLTGPETGVGQLLEVMVGCAEQIGFLSRQLLNFRRGGKDLELRPTQLADLLKRAVGLVPALADVELRKRLGDDTRIQCSAPLLIQAVTNLLENAAHAAGPKGWVELSSHTEGGRVRVEVADSGPGVPVGLRDRVFEPFFTTKGPGTGTGLGLSVSRAIVQRHSGTLDIRERSGRSVFVIDLPVDSLAETNSPRYDDRALRA